MSNRGHITTKEIFVYLIYSIAVSSTDNRYMLPYKALPVLITRCTESHILRIKSNQRLMSAQNHYYTKVKIERNKLALITHTLLCRCVFESINQCEINAK